LQALALFTSSAESGLAKLPTFLFSAKLMGTPGGDVTGVPRTAPEGNQGVAVRKPAQARLAHLELFAAILRWIGRQQLARASG
jgi:hypothetical protein